MAYNIIMVFLETSVFTKRIVECLTDSEYAEFQNYLMEMLYAYLKNEREDLTRSQLKILAEITKESINEEK